jgi:Zn-dependent peptidase ImmA (M78 family)
VDTIDTYEHAESIQFALSFLMPTAEFYRAIKTFSENREMKTDLSQVCKYFGVVLSDVVFYGRNLGIIKE